jgi:hypothetical protein
MERRSESTLALTTSMTSYRVAVVLSFAPHFGRHNFRAETAEN